MEADLFSKAQEHRPSPPASAIRPEALDELLGQQHILGLGGPLRRRVRAGRLGIRRDDDTGHQIQAQSGTRSDTMDSGDDRSFELSQTQGCQVQSVEQSIDRCFGSLGS